MQAYSQSLLEELYCLGMGFWIPDDTYVVRFFIYAILWTRNDRHFPLVFWLPGLWLLERTEHDKDDVAVLYRLHRAGGIGFSLA